MDDSAPLDESQIAQFDFVGDERFRNSLISDYGEILRSMRCGAWKAVHVLAGSVVEAVLVDYLVTTDYQKKHPNKDPLKMELGPIIDACKMEGVLSQRTADLSSVIRDYRNLIHPGKVIRLNERLSSNSGMIAKTLVDVIVEEISRDKASTYGFTAEQIVNKISKDSSAMTVLAHFLKETKEFERERLLTRVIPERYFSLSPQWEANASDERDRLASCFRQTLDTLPNDRKAVVAKQFVKVLREGAEEKVSTYETAFFRASDLQYLNSSDASLAKQHLLSRIEREQTEAVIGALDGIGGFLNEAEIRKVTGFLLRAVVYGKSDPAKVAAEAALYDIGRGVSDELGVIVRERVDEWVAMLTGRGQKEDATTVKRIREFLDIPF